MWGWKGGPAWGRDETSGLGKQSNQFSTWARVEWGSHLAIMATTPSKGFFALKDLTHHSCAWSMGRVCNGAVIKCTLGLGKPKGGWNFGREGTGARWRTRGVSLQATRDWGGRFLSQLGGFQVSRRELARGNQSKGNAPCTVEHCNSCLCIYWNDWIDERYQLYV